MKILNLYKYPGNFLLLIILALLFGTACKKKKDDPSTPDKQTLMTINFQGDFINPKLKAIVFVSDMAGIPLADTTITGNPSVVLYAKTVATPPYQVTIVKWEPDMHNFLVTMMTYQYVMPGEWTIHGKRRVSAGDVAISLKNIPPHTGPILYSGSGHSNHTFATSGTFPLYKSPDELYIRINTASGPMFKWTYGLSVGANIDVDLSSMDKAEKNTITLPFMAQDFNARVYGYHDTDYTSALPVMTDEVLGNGTSVDKVVVSYPADDFISFQTRLEMIESWTSLLTYSYTRDGTIPESFVKTGAEITDIQTTGNKVGFKTTGSFTVTAATWTFLDAGNLAFEWTVYGPDTISSVTLPALPGALTNMFPTLSLDSLHLKHIELTDHQDISSYPAYLHAIFNPASPGRGSHLQASGVKIRLD